MILDVAETKGKNNNGHMVVPPGTIGPDSPGTMVYSSFQLVSSMLDRHMWPYSPTVLEGFHVLTWRVQQFSEAWPTKSSETSQEFSWLVG